MKKILKVKKKQEALSLITGITYARVPSWYGYTRSDLKMDIIMPKHHTSHELLPAILWFCGGAFSVVDRSVWIPQMMEFARRGYVVASAEYRTSNAVSFPEPLKDVKAAVRFLRANATEFCIDPGRIVAMGESAGGTMATLLGVTNGMPEYEQGEYLETSSCVQAVVDFYGVTKFNLMLSHNEEDSVPDWVLPAFIGGYSPEKVEDASAIKYIGSNTPPFMIFHGSSDALVPIENSEELYNTLISHGINADFYVLDGAEHGDDLFYQQEIYDLIDSFLKKNL